MWRGNGGGEGEVVSEPTLEQRLERLERQNRILRWVLIAVLTAGLLAWIAMPRAGRYQIVSDVAGRPQHRMDTRTGEVHVWDESLGGFITLEGAREKKEARRRAVEEAHQRRKAEKKQLRNRWVDYCISQGGNRLSCGAEAYKLVHYSGFKRRVIKFTFEYCDREGLEDSQCFREMEESGCFGKQEAKEACSAYFRKLIEAREGNSHE